MTSSRERDGAVRRSAYGGAMKPFGQEERIRQNFAGKSCLLDLAERVLLSSYWLLATCHLAQGQSQLCTTTTTTTSGSSDSSTPYNSACSTDLTGFSLANTLTWALPDGYERRLHRVRAVESPRTEPPAASLGVSLLFAEPVTA